LFKINKSSFSPEFMTQFFAGDDPARPGNQNRKHFQRLGLDAEQCARPAKLLCFKV